MNQPKLACEKHKIQYAMDKRTCIVAETDCSFMIVLNEYIVYGQRIIISMCLKFFIGSC